MRPTILELGLTLESLACGTFVTSNESEHSLHFCLLFHQFPYTSSKFISILTMSLIAEQRSYNSAVFKVTVGRDYEVQFVNASDSFTMAWLNQNANNLTNGQWKSQYASQYIGGTGTLYLVADKVGTTLKISETKNVCLDTHGTPSITNFGTIKMGSSIGVSETLVAYPLDFPKFSNCDGSTFELPQGLKVKAAETQGLQSLTNYNQLPWVTFNGQPSFHITHGFATTTPSGSEVQIGIHFMVIVIFCNFMKLCTMSWTLRRPLSSQIVTIGDAISSFLKTPHPGTRGMSTLHRKAVIRRETPTKIYEPFFGRYVHISGERHVILRLTM